MSISPVVVAAFAVALLLVVLALVREARLRRALQQLLWWTSAMLVAVCVIGCSSSDDRYVQLSQQSVARQAEQNRQMAQQSQQVAEATHELVQADARARAEMIEAQRSLEGFEGYMNVLVKLRRHVGQIELQIFHLSFGEILGQQTCAERPRIIEYRSPVERTNAFVPDFEHVAGFGALHKDRAGQRVDAVAVDREILRKRHARMHLGAA